MKVGVVGLGFMGSTHLGAYAKIRQVEVTALCCEDEAKLCGDLATVQGNFGGGAEPLDLGQAARYSKLDDLLTDDNVEAVDLCVPTYLHAGFTLAALAAGKHVLVEKPMALRGEDCDAMVDAARQANRVLMVAQVLRFWPDYAVARKLVRSGDLGPVVAASFRRRCAAPSWGKWLGDPAKSGGGVFDLLIHDLDCCLHLFGKPDSISATGVEKLEQGVDIAEVRPWYADGPRVSISGGWHHTGAYPFLMGFTIVCEGGTLDFDSRLNQLTLFTPDGSSQPELPETDAFESELIAFADACAAGQAPAICQPEESALATKMALAMRASRERGGAAVAV